VWGVTLLVCCFSVCACGVWLNWSAVSVFVRVGRDLIGLLFQCLCVWGVTEGQRLCCWTTGCTTACARTTASTCATYIAPSSCVTRMTCASFLTSWVFKVGAMWLTFRMLGCHILFVYLAAKLYAMVDVIKIKKILRVLWNHLILWTIDFGWRWWTCSRTLEFVDFK